MKLQPIIICVIFMTLSQCVFADVRLPQIFSDGMILQREKKVPVWGWGDEGEKVIVEFSGQTKSTSVKDGKWRVNLDPMQADAKPQVMTVKGKNTIQIKNVLVGEVWFTCGQSNMMMSLNSTMGGDEFYSQHQPKSKDLFRVVLGMGSHLMNDTPQEDVQAAWREPDAGFSAVSYYFAQKLFDHLGGKVPVGIVCYVAIVPAEAWVDAGRIAGHPNLKHLKKSPLKVTSKGFNGTIAPISPYAIRGVAYYQGEYNGGRAQEFRYLFPALIDSWREAWEKPNLPFLYVQLPGYLYHKAGKDSKLDMDAATLARQKRNAKTQWVHFRDVQRWIWHNTKNTGMVCAIDLGEKYDIHPKNKEPIGDRLLAQARKLAYGEDVVASGAYPKSCKAVGNAIVVDYDDAGSGLIVKGENLDGFEVAGIDGNYVKAKAMLKGASVVVSSDDLKEPLHVRYAWEGFPPTTLYNKEGYPALPFNYLTPGKTFYPDTAEFEIFNPSFEEKKGDKPTSWTLRGEVSSIENGSNGANAISLGKKGYIGQEKMATGAGYYWNCPPDTEHFLRPGSVVGYSVDLASGTEGQEAKAYMNMACNQNAGGAYGMWMPIHIFTVNHPQWERYSLGHHIVDQKIRPALYKEIGGRWFSQSETSPLLVDNFSEVQIIRPTMTIGSIAPITLTAGETSKPIVITNSQSKTYAQKLGPDKPAIQVATLLYGCAGRPIILG
jgi:sialate O-acetylesterase